MMKIILAFILTCLVFSSCGSQNSTEPAQYAAFRKVFVRAFNDNDYKKIIKNTSDYFLKSISESETIEFLRNLRTQGKIVQMSFINFSRGFAVYRTESENKVVYELLIGLDNQSQVIGLTARNLKLNNYNESLPLTKSQTQMELPFDGTWFVFWGGDTESENAHVTVKSQRNAFDLVVVDSSFRSYKTNGKTNEDYFAFGQKIYAPCDGEIVALVEGVKDNIPGEMNPSQLTGNSITIKSKQGEYILLAHFKLNSIAIKKGQVLKSGQFIGLCGNSGNSSEPHLHLHIMDKPSMEEGTGIKCYFDKMKVNGVLKEHYSPVREDKIEKVD